MKPYVYLAGLWLALSIISPVSGQTPSPRAEKPLPEPQLPTVLSRPAIQRTETSTGTVATDPTRLPTTDSLPVFTADEFYQAVMRYHPIVKQAGLLSEEAQALVQSARGAFDPKLYSDYHRKNFGNTLYYDKWQSGLSVPVLPGGLDVKLTYDRNKGEYLNPENSVPASGLIGVGVSIPLTQGLLFDARRNILRQAQVAVNLASADRLALINKTLLDAADSYWDWYLTYQQFRWVERGYQLAQARFMGIRQRALIGDAAPIDTTEALITAQERLVQRQQATVALQNARLNLTAYLWRGEVGTVSQPVDLPATVAPQAAFIDMASQDQFEKLLDQATQQHPDIRKLAFKQQQLTIEERYRRALLRPKVSVEASLLSRGPLSPVLSDGSSAYDLGTDNYKIGVDFLFPLFLRAERGKLRQVQLQNQQVALEQQQVGRTVAIGVERSWNEVVSLRQQIVTQQETTANQQALVRAEVAKFQLGESSLFLLNSRETKFIDFQIKLEELRSKQQKALAKLWYAAGTNGAIR